MQRGVYFDAWFPRQHCYHPSLPPRRLRMVEDLVDYRATVLVWALGCVHAIGAGSDASSPWLRTFMVATGVPILVLFAIRILRRPKQRPASAPVARVKEVQA